MTTSSLDNLTTLMDLGVPARIYMSAPKLYPDVDEAANFLMETEKKDKLDESEESDSRSEVDQSSVGPDENPRETASFYQKGPDMENVLS